jgi:hypothetical protein
VAKAQIGNCATGREKVVTINGEMGYIWKERAKLLSWLST